ncbi:RNA polymerase II-associated protein 3 [Ciona intestinalis]
MNSPMDMLKLQMNVRENASEVNDFLRDLDSWETDIKKKDKVYNQMKPQNQEKVLQPIRRGVAAQKKETKKLQEKEPTKKAKRLRSGDYRSWDKLDVDAMLEDIDNEEKEEEKEIEVESEKKKLEFSIKAKEEGNKYFKAGKYEDAVNSYTKSMEYDPTNAVFPANRAMAYLKLQKFIETEADCTLSLSLDPAYTKAYLRRGSARVAMGKVGSAVKDFNDALKLEPNNNQALKELESIKREGNKDLKQEDTKPEDKKRIPKKGVVLPVIKALNRRSKKPLRRIHVTEIPAANTAVQPSKIKVENTTSKFEQGASKTESNTTTTKLTPSEKNNSARIPEENCTQTIKATSPTPIPAAPSTCFQFHAALRTLQHNTKAIYTYLQQIPTSTLNKLLKDQLEPSVLMTIIRCFSDCFSNNEDFAIEFLTAMSSAKRFDMIIMFLSKSDKNEVKSLFELMEKSYAKEHEKIASLSKKYCS